MLIEWVAFLLTVLCAVVFRWEARDLIWGLWLSSFCVGYALIVRVILGAILDRPKIIPLALALGGGAFMLIFFTFHFGMFHFVHSVFLSLFFPLLPKTDNGLPNVFLLALTAMKCYWPVVLGSLVVKWPDFQMAKLDLKKAGELMTKPYASVVKIHMLIFIFAGMSFVHIDRFAIYPIMAVFFFPIENLLKKKENPLS
jgi:hypothetical protein